MLLRLGSSSCGSFTHAVLKGLTLVLPRGTTTAIVGRSGAGKSTVAALLSRFYSPDAGGICLGGRPATDFTRGQWAKAVALVSQEPVLFSGALLRRLGRFCGTRGCLCGPLLVVPDCLSRAYVRRR